MSSPEHDTIPAPPPEIDPEATLPETPTSISQQMRAVRAEIVEHDARAVPLTTR